MPYDLFISYSRRDNQRGQVTALKAQIETSFRAFAGRDLRVFFDTHEIAALLRMPTAFRPPAQCCGQCGVSFRPLNRFADEGTR